MKKISTLLVAVLATVSLTACGSSSNSSSSSSSSSSKNSSSSSTRVSKSVRVMQNTNNTDLQTMGQKNAQELRYGDLIKSNDYYAKPYYISKGEVMQAQQGKGYTSLLVYTDDDTNQLFEVETPGKTKAIEDDYVSIPGVLDKLYSYKTQSNGSNTVPTIFTKKITVLGHDNDSY